MRSTKQFLKQTILNYGPIGGWWILGPRCKGLHCGSKNSSRKVIWRFHKRLDCDITANAYRVFRASPSKAIIVRRSRQMRFQFYRATSGARGGAAERA